MNNIEENSEGDFGFSKNIKLNKKNQNLEICTGTFSMRRIRPYGHIWPEIKVFDDFGGWGFCRIFSYIYIYIL